MAVGNSKFKAGMYLLETLTAGMYNDPLSIYREYIQNSVDSFELVKKSKKPGPQLIKIDIDPFKRNISISDNAFGIPFKSAEGILSIIGGSQKRKGKFRGFRGIGRLGGLAFCDKAIFKTKALGENVESVQEWDCKQLRSCLSDTKYQKMSLGDLFKETTYFYNSNNKKPEGSYFKVELIDVSSFRNHILDISQIEKYLQSTAPLPFNPDEFTYAKEISEYLSSKIPNYVEMKIKLNGKQIFKPYKDEIRCTNKRRDFIVGTDFFDVTTNEGQVAFGWTAKRKNFIGAIDRGEGISGIKVRDGNIMIGDEHLLDNCFRETRFNSYVLGEIHITTQKLLPNSRRDDFVDNQMKTDFYNMIDCYIGLPISKEIRLRSRLNSKKPTTQLKQAANNDLQDVPSTNQYNLSKNILTEKTAVKKVTADKLLEEIFKECRNCEKLKNIRRKYNI